MFDFLNGLDTSIKLRYITVEKNIKSKSNSFYDSYLDLLETTIKTILDDNKINYDERKTCGFILKEKEVVSFFKNEIMIDECLYNKLFDYIKKINDHKHKAEKYVSQETIINFMHVYFQFLTSYFEYSGIKENDFPSEKYYMEIFGITEKQNKDYRSTYEKLEKKLDLLVEQRQLSQEEMTNCKVVSLRDIDTLNLEEQNYILKENINKLKAVSDKIDSLDDKLNSLEKKINSSNEKRFVNNNSQHIDIIGFLKTSKKEHIWFGSTKEFNKSKLYAKLSLISLILIGIISTIVSSIVLRIYSTFTFIENIWLIFACILFVYVCHNQKMMLDTDLATHDNCLYVMNQDGAYVNTNKEKKRFRWTRRASYFAVFLNIIYLWITSTGPLVIFATILELFFFIVTILAYYLYLNFTSAYGMFIFFTNKSLSMNIRTIIFDVLRKQVLTKEEFNEKYAEINQE